MRQTELSRRDKRAIRRSDKLSNFRGSPANTSLEQLQLLLCQLVVKALTLKLRIKASFLSLKVRYLPFQICKLVLSKGKLLIEQGCGAVLRN